MVRFARLAALTAVATGLIGCGSGSTAVPMTDEQVRAHEKARGDAERKARKDSKVPKDDE